jgi:Mg2+ and Co2+ transporter CorA
MANNRNSITGDKIITKHKSKSFDDNFDAIFRKPEEPTWIDVLEMTDDELNKVDKDADQT